MNRSEWIAARRDDAIRTQIHYARNGIITGEMEHVARRERISAELIREEVARGRMIIPANIHHHTLEPMCIGVASTCKITDELDIEIADGRQADEIVCPGHETGKDGSKRHVAHHCCLFRPYCPSCGMRAPQMDYEFTVHFSITVFCDGAFQRPPDVDRLWPLFCVQFRPDFECRSCDIEQGFSSLGKMKSVCLNNTKRGSP